MPGRTKIEVLGGKRLLAHFLTRQLRSRELPFTIPEDMLRWSSLLLLVVALLRPATAQAQDARTWLWISSSATLLCASLAGVHALKVEAVYDRSRIIPGVSPERLALRRDAGTAELTADVFFIATGVFGISSLVLWWTLPNEQPSTSVSLAPTPHGASLIVRGRL